MATKQGEYLKDDAIEVVYQAVGLATGKTITMSVYDATHALDAPKSGTMTEIGATGRYYKAFTPNAEGIWTVIIINTTDSNGPVVKQYAVCGHSIDDIGDAVAANKTVVDGIQTDLSNETDGLGALKTLIDAKAATTEITALDGVIDAGFAAAATAASIAALDSVVDAGFAAIASPAMVG
jgi:hypothetical protein